MIRDHGSIHAKKFGNLGLLLPFIHLLFDKYRQFTRFQIFPLQILDDLLIISMRPIDKRGNRGFPSSLGGPEPACAKIQNPSFLLGRMRTDRHGRFDAVQSDTLLQFLHARRIEFLTWLSWIFINILDWNLKRTP